MLSQKIFSVQDIVAPFAGAWIEIAHKPGSEHERIWSLPSRERGLKSAIMALNALDIQSLPSRERGLKLGMYAAKRTETYRRSLRGSVD